MQNFNVDKPIVDIKEDKLGRESFVDTLVNGIENYKSKESLTIGLYGKWGSGKTSILNLVENKLKSKEYKVIKFNPWNFKEQDELIQAFFKELYQQLKLLDCNEVFTKSAKIFKILARIVSLGIYNPFTHIYAKVLAPLIKEYGETLENLTYKKSLNDLKNKITRTLDKLGTKIVVIIDDIDRLNDNEIVQIFQLVKLLANFNNIVYILSFDKDVVLSALKQSQTEFSTSYLEKIIQVPLIVPEVQETKIQEVLLTNLNDELANSRETLSYRNGDIMHTYFLNQFNTIREVNRFINLFDFKFNALKNNVDFHDLIILTILEMKYPQIYSFIYNSREKITGTFDWQFSSTDRTEQELKQYVYSFMDTQKSKLGEKDFSFVLEALKFLFPKICSIYPYSAYTLNAWQEAKIRGFIHIRDNIDKYFVFNSEKELYSNSDIEDCLLNYDKDNFKKFILQLNENNGLGTFISYLNYYITEKLEFKRAKEIIDWFLELENAFKEEEPKEVVFYRDFIQLFDRVFIKFLEKFKNQLNIFEYIKNFYGNGKISLFKVEILRSLQNQCGRMYKGQTEKAQNPLLTEEQIVEVEKIILPVLKIFMASNQSLSTYNFKEYYYLMKVLDEKFTNNLVNEFLKDANTTLDLIKHFVIRGTHLNYNLTKTYSYKLSTINEIAEIEKIYNILIKDIINHTNLAEEINKIYLAFIMTYENYKNDDDDSYTESDMKKYLKEKHKITTI